MYTRGGFMLMYGKTNAILQSKRKKKKEPAFSVDLGPIPGLGRSPGEGKGNSLQYSCLENPWTEEPGSLQFIGLTEWDMTEAS